MARFRNLASKGTMLPDGAKGQYEGHRTPDRGRRCTAGIALCGNARIDIIRLLPDCESASALCESPMMHTEDLLSAFAAITKSRSILHGLL